jgi:hypothetical protein
VKPLDKEGVIRVDDIRLSLLVRFRPKANPLLAHFTLMHHRHEESRFQEHLTISNPQETRRAQGESERIFQTEYLRA